MANIGRKDGNTSWWGCRETGTPSAAWSRLPQNVKHRITMWPRNSIPRPIAKRIENMHITTKLCPQVSKQHCSLETKIGLIQMSNSWWMDRIRMADEYTLRNQTQIHSDSTHCSVQTGSSGNRKERTGKVVGVGIVVRGMRCPKIRLCCTNSYWMVYLNVL